MKTYLNLPSHLLRPSFLFSRSSHWNHWDHCRRGRSTLSLDKRFIWFFIFLFGWVEFFGFSCSWFADRRCGRVEIELVDGGRSVVLDGNIVGGGGGSDRICPCWLHRAPTVGETLTRASQLWPPCRRVQTCVLIDKICVLTCWLGWDGERFLFFFCSFSMSINEAEESMEWDVAWLNVLIQKHLKIFNFLWYFICYQLLNIFFVTYLKKHHVFSNRDVIHYYHYI